MGRLWADNIKKFTNPLLFCE